MLYAQWRRIARERSGHRALQDLASGKAWSFAELFEAGEQERLADSRESCVYPQGQNASFITSLLAAWREDRVVCPLEIGQAPPRVSDFPSLARHLKCTSASTGPARVVAFTGEQLAADAQNIIATMGLSPGSPNLGVISMAHSYGFSNLVLPLLLHGIPLVLLPAPLPEILRRAASEYPSVTVAAVPALWRAWHDAGAIPGNVSAAISAGAPLPLPLEEAVFERCGLKIHNFYGSTECGGIAYDRADAPRREPTLAGSPMDNVELSLGKDGCLVVRSKAVGIGYCPDASPNLGEGTFKTADLVKISEGGVHLLGRASDVINIAGRKLSPDAVEQALRQHPGVRDCLVFGLPEAGERTEKVAVVVAAQADQCELRSFLLSRLPAWQVPREWKVVPDLPINSRGKLSRAEWRERWLSGA